VALTFTLFALPLLGSPAFEAHAQVYRCGSTYSQTPCAPDATAKNIRPGAAVTRGPGMWGYELCAARAPSETGSPEPETARVRQVGDRRIEVIQFAGRPVAAHRYDLHVQAKTANGVYGAPVIYSCWLSEDQARLLEFARR
jgi:hypothetical protein